MAYLKYPISQGRCIYSRRSFVRLSALALAGISVSQCTLGLPTGSKMLVYVPFIAEVLGYVVIAKTVSDYLTGKSSKLAGDVADVNDAMAEGGFTGEQTPVYVDSAGNFAYAVENVDGIDACLPFYGPSSYKTMVEGPGIVAIAAGADEVRQSASKEIARQLFIPSEGIQDNRGRLNSSYGYSRPSLYRNLSGGEVSIDYVRTGQNNGLIKIDSKSGPGLYRETGYDGYRRELEFSFPTA